MGGMGLKADVGGRIRKLWGATLRAFISRVRTDSGPVCKKARAVSIDDVKSWKRNPVTWIDATDKASGTWLTCHADESCVEVFCAPCRSAGCHSPWARGLTH